MTIVLIGAILGAILAGIVVWQIPRQRTEAFEKTLVPIQYEAAPLTWTAYGTILGILITTASYGLYQSLGLFDWWLVFSLPVGSGLGCLIGLALPITLMMLCLQLPDLLTRSINFKHAPLFFGWLIATGHGLPGLLIPGAIVGLLGSVILIVLDVFTAA